MAWAPDYVTVDELGQYVDVDDLDDEFTMGLAITAAARAVDEATNRQFGQVTTAEQRLYTAWYDYGRCRWVVTIDDVQDSTGLVVEVDGTPVATYTLEPVNAAAEGRPWTRIAFDDDSEATPCGEAHGVAVTALWGWSEVPSTVRQATLLQASRFLTRKDSPFGVAGSPELGSEMRLLAKVDPDVAVALRGYQRARAVG